MDNDQLPDFYKDKYFDGLAEDIRSMKKDISDIKSKVVYMYGFAAAIGIVFSFAIDWIRTSLFPGAH